MGKLLKAVTFSYDDGVEQDVRLVELFNKYNLRATFNLNSGIMTPDSVWTNKGIDIRRMVPDDMKALYAGHEIASHGTCHLSATKLEDKEEFKKEFFEDIVSLEDIFDKRVQGMAYAYGHYDDKTVEYLKSLGIRYARTVESNHSFDIQTDLLRFKPTCHHTDDALLDVAKSFIDLKADKPQILYIWGHSYEFDVDNNWDRFEELLKLISNREDIFYGTNTEVFEYFGLY